jgi:hypothetical protein
MSTTAEQAARQAPLEIFGGTHRALAVKIEVIFTQISQMSDIAPANGGTTCRTEACILNAMFFLLTLRA